MECDYDDYCEQGHALVDEAKRQLTALTGKSRLDASDMGLLRACLTVLDVTVIQAEAA